VASSSGATVTGDIGPVPGGSYPASAYMGCLLSTGRQRLLERYDVQDPYASETSATGFATAGKLASLVEADGDPHYGAVTDIVRVFDLGTGARIQSLGGEQVVCPGMGSCGADTNQLVMNADGFTAVHMTTTYFGRPTDTQRLVNEQIVASDSTGVHDEDTALRPPPSIPCRRRFSPACSCWAMR
jgi:hypothetical protein